MPKKQRYAVVRNWADDSMSGVLSKLRQTLAENAERRGDRAVRRRGHDSLQGTVAHHGLPWVFDGQSAGSRAPSGF